MKSFNHILLKMKFTAITLLLTLAINAQTIVEKHGLLRVSGNTIVDKNDNPISLAGNSLFWSNAGDVDDFYKSEVVDHLADEWNASIIRASLGVKETWDNGTGYIDDPITQEAKMRRVIDAAIAKGVYVILDWHSHEAEKYQDEAVAFFGKIAGLYGDAPNLIYEIYNEPINQSWSEIKSYAEAVTSAIRAEDPDNLIVVGTPFYSQQVDIASTSPLSDNNTAYTLHFYAGTHRQWLRDKAITAMNNGVALFVTEWGTVSASGDGGIDRPETELWLSFLKENNISHVNWTISDKDESSCVVLPLQGVTGLLNEQLTASGEYVKAIIQSWSEAVSTTNPSVSFESPSGDEVIRVGETLTIQVAANDADGTIARVELLIGGNAESPLSSAPYSWELTDLAVGSYTVKAIATDNDGNTSSASFNLTVIPENGTSCTFGAPTVGNLPTIYGYYTYAHMLGTAPTGLLDNLQNFSISWDFQNNGLHQLSIQTTNGAPNWWTDLRSMASYRFSDSQPEITFTNTGFVGLDGAYWVTTDGDNFVMVSKTGDFTIYFSNSQTPPACDGAVNRTISALHSPKDHPSMTAIKAYPTPTTSELILQNTPSEASKAIIYDLKGTKVMTKNIIKTDQTSLNIQHLNEGIYLIQILSADNHKLFESKIIKQ